MVILAEGVVVGDRFRLVRRIGQGGMGSVWRATHLGLDAPCAVKFIEGQLSDVAEAHGRFEREAKAAAQLRSPNVVQIFDHGVWEGHPYIAMELLEGDDLGKHLAKSGGRLPPEDVCFVVEQVCRALARAHQAGVVHRDLKPDNIFVVRDDDRDIVKILDFGIAKSALSPLQGQSTKTGALIGTPYYMSPEQAQGTKTVDARSDLWSLAVIVFQCLTGRPPFESEALGALLLKIIVEPLPIPSHSFEAVPPGFDSWWLKAADRDPDRRHPTAKAFAESLSLALGQSSTPESMGRRRLHRGSDVPKLANATILTPLGQIAPDAPRPQTPTSSRQQTGGGDTPTRVALEAIRVISGDDEVRALVEGLSEGISGAFARSTAIEVKTGDRAGADFLLKGSVQAVGKRLRFTFILEEIASSTQVWTERYDRLLDDVFGLQDEIVGYLASAIRGRIKVRLLERLRTADDATLALPQLLDKAAGLFQMLSLVSAHQAVAALRVAVERAPDSSMATAMLGYGLFEVAEYDAMALAPTIADEILTLVDRAVTLDPRSYVARTFKAMMAHDLEGDAGAAHVQAGEALKQNATFVKARAMLAISEIHLGEVDAGLKSLKQVMAEGAEDASHTRHRRELAIAHWLHGDAAEGMRVATTLCQDAPDRKRNAVVVAGLSGAAGELETARRYVAALRKAAPGITLATARLPPIDEREALERFRKVMRDAGLE